MQNYLMHNLKSGIRNGTEVTLNLSSNLIVNIIKWYTSQKFIKL